MKLQFSLASIVLVGCSVISSNAFVARNVAASKASTTSLFANSANIRAAMEATEKYGPTSPEARLAWEGKSKEIYLYSCVVHGMRMCVSLEAKLTQTPRTKSSHYYVHSCR